MHVWAKYLIPGVRRHVLFPRLWPTYETMEQSRRQDQKSGPERDFLAEATSLALQLDPVAWEFDLSDRDFDKVVDIACAQQPHVNGAALTTVRNKTIASIADCMSGKKTRYRVAASIRMTVKLKKLLQAMILSNLSRLYSLIHAVLCRMQPRGISSSPLVHNIGAACTSLSISAHPCPFKQMLPSRHPYDTKNNHPAPFKQMPLLRRPHDNKDNLLAIVVAKQTAGPVAHLQNSLGNAVSKTTDWK